MKLLFPKYTKKYFVFSGHSAGVSPYWTTAHCSVFSSFFFLLQPKYIFRAVLTELLDQIFNSHVAAPEPVHLKHQGVSLACVARPRKYYLSSSLERQPFLVWIYSFWFSVISCALHSSSSFSLLPQISPKSPLNLPFSSFCFSLQSMQSSSFWVCLCPRCWSRCTDWASSLTSTPHSTASTVWWVHTHTHSHLHTRMFPCVSDIIMLVSAECASTTGQTKSTTNRYLSTSAVTIPLMIQYVMVQLFDQ